VAGLLLLTTSLGVAVAASPHLADGLLLDWAGHGVAATDVFPPADAPVNFEIRRAFATREQGVLFLRLDVDAAPTPPPTTRFVGATSSQPLALSANGDVLAVVNPDNDSASFFDLRGDANLRFGLVATQTEPSGVAVMPDGRRAYVANAVSGTVSVIDLDVTTGTVTPPTTQIVVGTEPVSLVLTPNGSRLYVANARSNTVSVIDTSTNTVVATRPVGLEPRGLAVTHDGDADDTDEKLYVTSFLAFPIAGRAPGRDDAGEGHVTVISTATDTVIATAIVQPMTNTGFNANGDALARVAPGAAFTFPTGAYPNQLNNVAIRGGFAYLPNTGASPNGPVRFDVNTQALLSVLDTSSDTDAGLTLNLNQAVAAQASPSRLFPTQPWAMAFRNASDLGYVVSAASNVVLKLAVDPLGGGATVLADPLDPTRVFEIPVGKNPRGIVVNWNDSRAYVMNYVSRDVTVLDLTGTREQVMATLPSETLPTPGTAADLVHAGRELYNTSIGVFDPATSGGPSISGRLSTSGWGSCASCHPSGLSDQVVWIFPSGPRRTIPQHADFDPVPPETSQRILGWSAIRDEQEDFELHLRTVMGGAGLIVQGDGVTPEPAVNDFLPLANAGRNQLQIRGVGAWDALVAYVDDGVRAPIPAVQATSPDAIAGRALFISANCQQCHGGDHWTSGRLTYTPPPAPAQVVGGQLLSALRNVGTFDSGAFNEVRDNAGAPLGADGFSPPSLLSGFAFEGFQLHGGAAVSFDEVLANVTHRSAGTGGVDTLSSAADRARIAIFLRSIGAATTPVP
jgi:YVTN family beta-propeller protein